MTLTVDNDTYHGSGQTEVGQDLFQSVLFGINNLTSGLHDITITNKALANGTQTYFDVDFVMWEGSLPDNSNPLSVTSTNATGFEYLPNDSIWTPNDESNSYSEKVYSTDQSSSEVRLNFTGQSFAIYGSLDKTHGNFSCSIDGMSLGIFSGNYPTNVERQLVCFRDGLDNNTHVLTVENHPISNRKARLSIDYVEIHGNHAYVHIHLFVLGHVRLTSGSFPLVL